MEILANTVAALHVMYFLFVMGGFCWLLARYAKGSRWLRSPWLRVMHFAAVLVVPAEDVFGLRCPLNVAESSLRESARTANAAATSGVSSVLDVLLRHTIPGWFLDGMYWVLGCVLLVLLFVLPPRWRSDSASG
jgi:hypothetical protein